jgi:hypothetical protein
VPNHKATAWWRYNPIYQKPIALEPVVPWSWFYFYGPDPAAGTSYGLFVDGENSLNVVAPKRQIIYSPISGKPMELMEEETLTKEQMEAGQLPNECDCPSCGFKADTNAESLDRCIACGSEKIVLSTKGKKTMRTRDVMKAALEERLARKRSEASSRDHLLEKRRNALAEEAEMEHAEHGYRSDDSGKAEGDSGTISFDEEAMKMGATAEKEDYVSLDEILEAMAEEDEEKTKAEDEKSCAKDEYVSLDEILEAMSEEESEEKGEGKEEKAEIEFKAPEMVMDSKDSQEKHDSEAWVTLDEVLAMLDKKAKERELLREEIIAEYLEEMKARRTKVKADAEEEKAKAEEEEKAKAEEEKAKAEEEKAKAAEEEKAKAEEEKAKECAEEEKAKAAEEEKAKAAEEEKAKAAEEEKAKAEEEKAKECAEEEKAKAEETYFAEMPKQKEPEMHAEKAECAKCVAGEEHEHEEVAESMRFEPLASLESLASVKKEAIDMMLFGEEGQNPTWNISVAGIPVCAINLKDQDHSDEIRRVFCSEQYAEDLADHCTKSGFLETMKKVNARFWSNYTSNKKIEARYKAEATAKYETDKRKFLDTFKKDFLQALSVVTAGANKNFFQLENPLKDCLFANLTTLGLPETTAVSAIEKSFKEGGAEHFATLFAKAEEFMSLTSEAKAEIAKAIGAADTVPVAVDTNAGSLADSNISHRLAQASAVAEVMGGSSLNVRNPLNLDAADYKSQLKAAWRKR